MIEDYNVEAEVAQSITTRYGTAYRVKILVADHGFYINGMMVYPPNVDHEEWGVTPPGMPRQAGKFVVEFNKKHALWSQVEMRCIEVAKEYENEAARFEPPIKKQPFKKDVVIDDIPDGPITLDDIPDF